MKVSFTSPMIKKNPNVSAKEKTNLERKVLECMAFKLLHCSVLVTRNTKDHMPNPTMKAQTTRV